MVLRVLLAVVAVFVVWSGIDALVHGVLLGPTYEETAELWRAPEEMKTGLMGLVTAVAAVCFTAIYAVLVRPKGVAAGLEYGLLWGVAVGIGMGFGSYSYMPIPLKLAVVWFATVVVEGLVGGLLVAPIVGRPKAQEAAA
jgi:hypothetical protein